MTTDQRLESYLTALEQVLKPIPVSDRAEIVTEIKSHVLATLERDPQARLDTVLAALGEPETVANRYLIERGLKPTKPPISPVVKWIVIGFLGTFAMLLIFAGILFMRFTPLVQVDDAEDRISLLGGMIEVDGDSGWQGNSHKFSGEVALNKGQEVVLKFGNGKIDFTNGEGSKFSWRCSSFGTKALDPRPKSNEKGISFDLTDMAGVKCEFIVPEGVALSVEGSNGKLEFDQPRYSLAATLINGKVDILPASGQAYRYDLAVTNGKIDSFVSSDKSDAYAISIRLTNGKISRVTEEK